MELGRLGLWARKEWCNGLGRETLAELEELGVSALWVGGSPAADLAIPERLLAASTSLVVATGIVNVWSDPAEVAASAYHRLAPYSDRLLIGIGPSHPQSMGDVYRKPFEKLVDYLDGLDAGGVPRASVILAALGPRVLRLAAERSAGAHPYLTTPEHTAKARELLGAGKLLVPELTVVLEEDPTEARRLAREMLSRYLVLTNYTNNWMRFGFSEEDITAGGSDRLVDAMVAWGDMDAIRARGEAHLAAGADQVTLQILNPDPMAALRQLAPALR
jgi:probable F420-dependent oxidoreductase